MLGQRPRGSLSLQGCNTSALLRAQPLLSGLLWTQRPQRARVCVCGEEEQEAYAEVDSPTAAVFQKFAMRSGVFLLLLAALTCGLARGDDGEGEELQVETLVSETRAFRGRKARCSGHATDTHRHTYTVCNGVNGELF